MAADMISELSDSKDQPPQRSFQSLLPGQAPEWEEVQHAIRNSPTLRHDLEVSNEPHAECTAPRRFSALRRLFVAKPAKQHEQTQPQRTPKPHSSLFAAMAADMISELSDSKDQPPQRSFQSLLPGQAPEWEEVQHAIRNSPTLGHDLEVSNEPHADCTAPRRFQVLHAEVVQNAEEHSKQSKSKDEAKGNLRKRRVTFQCDLSVSSQ